MNHPKLTEEERQAAVAEADDKLKRLQMKERANNNTRIAQSVLKQLGELRPLSPSENIIAGDNLHILFWNKKDFDSYSIAPRPCLLMHLERTLEKITKASVGLQHLLGDIVHRRNNP